MTEETTSRIQHVERLMDSLDQAITAWEDVPVALPQDVAEGFTETTRMLWSIVYSSAIRSFLATMETAKFVQEDAEYVWLQPFVERWRLCVPRDSSSTQSGIGEVTYGEFIAGLQSMSEAHPDALINGLPLVQWYKRDIWDLGFDAWFRRIGSLANRAMSLLDRDNQWIQALLASNFALLQPFEFERFVADLLSKMGYSTEVTSPTGDFGVDVVARRDGEVVAVQVKRYSRENKVGNREVQMLLGAMQLSSLRATRAILVTTSDFTAQAHVQANGNPIELWNGDLLRQLVLKYCGQFLPPSSDTISA